MHDDSKFEYLWLPGLSDFREVWDMQKCYNAEVKAGKRRDTLIFLQHNPVYTLGIHGEEGNILDCGEAEVVRIDRGGDITFHGPGQLVTYIIMNLAAKGYGVKELVTRLEQAVIETCRHFGVEAIRRERAPGIWCDTPQGLKKICALGLRVKNGVTMHGLALNVSTDLSWFSGINPCGFEPGSATSLQERKEGKTIAITTVKEVLAEKLGEFL